MAQQFYAPPSSNYKGVDPRLRDIIEKAAAEYGLGVSVTPAGGNVRGKRSSRSRHVNPFGVEGYGGSAIDISLRDANGNVLPNYQSPAHFRAYEQFAQTARLIQQRDYPELANNFRWGGYFGGTLGKTYGAMDLMHFDLNPKGNMVAGTWENGLKADYAKAWGVPDSQGVSSAALTGKSPTPPAEIGGLGTRTLKRGRSGDDVRALQETLASLDLYDGPIDGKYGPATEKAVKDYQGRVGLDASGVVDKSTRNYIEPTYQELRGYGDQYGESTASIPSDIPLAPAQAAPVTPVERGLLGPATPVDYMGAVNASVDANGNPIPPFNPTDFTSAAPVGAVERGGLLSGLPSSWTEQAAPAPRANPLAGIMDWQGAEAPIPRMSDVAPAEGGPIPRMRPEVQSLVGSTSSPDAPNAEAAVRMGLLDSPVLTREAANELATEMERARAVTDLRSQLEFEQGKRKAAADMAADLDNQLYEREMARAAADIPRSVQTSNIQGDYTDDVIAVMDTPSRPSYATGGFDPSQQQKLADRSVANNDAFRDTFAFNRLQEMGSAGGLLDPRNLPIDAGTGGGVFASNPTAIQNMRGNTFAGMYSGAGRQPSYGAAASARPVTGEQAIRDAFNIGGVLNYTPTDRSSVNTTVAPRYSMKSEPYGPPRPASANYSGSLSNPSVRDMTYGAPEASTMAARDPYGGYNPAPATGLSRARTAAAASATPVSNTFNGTAAAFNAHGTGDLAGLLATGNASDLAAWGAANATYTPVDPVTGQAAATPAQGVTSPVPAVPQSTPAQAAPAAPQAGGGGLLTGFTNAMLNSPVGDKIMAEIARNAAPQQRGLLGFNLGAPTATDRSRTGGVSAGTWGAYGGTAEQQARTAASLSRMAQFSRELSDRSARSPANRGNTYNRDSTLAGYERV